MASARATQSLECGIVHTGQFAAGVVRIRTSHWESVHTETRPNRQNEGSDWLPGAELFFPFLAILKKVNDILRIFSGVGIPHLQNLRDIA